MEAQKPARGISEISSYNKSKMFKVNCECGSSDCEHYVDIEVFTPNDIEVRIYHTESSNFWEYNRFKQIWHLLTKGSIKLESTIVLNKQSALNYAEALKSTICDMDSLQNKEQ